MAQLAGTLPPVFCWTRFGTEAGESIEGILKRKEAERVVSGGLFFWGIGNSIAPAVAELIRQCDVPEVLFSPIRSRPRFIDVNPGAVVRWTTGETLAGRRFEFPRTARILSRAAPNGSTMPHYALVCSVDGPLTISDHGRLALQDLRNLMSGHALGASQVTAVVRDLGNRDAGSGNYLVAMRARLVAPYFVRLREPIAIHVSQPNEVAQQAFERTP